MLLRIILLIVISLVLMSRFMGRARTFGGGGPLVSYIYLGLGSLFSHSFMEKKSWICDKRG